MVKVTDCVCLGEKYVMKRSCYLVVLVLRVNDVNTLVSAPATEL